MQILAPNLLEIDPCHQENLTRSNNPKIKNNYLIRPVLIGGKKDLGVMLSLVCLSLLAIRTPTADQCNISITTAAVKCVRIIFRNHLISSKLTAYLASAKGTVEEIETHPTPKKRTRSVAQLNLPAGTQTRQPRTNIIMRRFVGKLSCNTENILSWSVND